MLIVVNNNGGQIFSLLPTPQSKRERFYLMPQNVHFDHAAAMFNLRYHRPENWEELESALAGAWRTPATTVIELVVNDTDGAQTLQQRFGSGKPSVMLHAQHMPGQLGAPSLVFLHGFSGDCREWQPVGEQFHGCSRLYIDLPGHGGSAAIPVGGFADVIRLLRATLISYNILKFWLVGYSLGGRVAMMAACQGIPGLCGLVVEGGHPGLQNEQARAERRLSDGHWAERFRREPLTEVFHDWYQQPVFASLTAQQRQALTALRSQNNGETLAAMLEATSLAAQPDLREALNALAFPFYYLCGERDSKFRALAQEVAATCHVIRNAGHNAHRENPAGVVDSLAQILRL